MIISRKKFNKAIEEAQKENEQSVCGHRQAADSA